MEGTLFKWTNYFSGWKERIFTLKGPLLSYFYTRGDKARARMHLGISSITAEEGSLFFEINTGSNIFYLKANTQEERDNWLKALNKARIEGAKQIKGATLTTSTLNKSEDFQIKPNYEKLIPLVDKLKQNNEKLTALLNEKNIVDSDISYLIQKNMLDIQKIEKLYNSNPNTIKDFTSSIQFEAEENNPHKNLRSKRRTIPLEEEEEIPKKGGNRITGNTLIKNDEVLYELSDGDFQEEEEENQDDFSDDKTPFKSKIQKMASSSNTYFPLTKELSLEDIVKSPIKYDFNLKTGNDFFDPLYDYPKRKLLPIEAKELSYNIWKIISSAVGKDLNKFGLPVFFNEPLSANQRFCENFQYVDLLNNAAIEPNPYLRLAYCGIFCIGGFAVDIRRRTKFFNPLLFETFEYVDNENNYRYFSEQVSHHPAITATYAEGKNWTFFTNFNAQIHLRITGKIEIYNLGRCYVTFKNFNDNIVFNKPLCVVRNIIMGNLMVDMEDKFEVKNDNGDVCEITMIPSTTGTVGNVKGIVKDLNGRPFVEITGNWLKDMTVKNLITGESKVVWKFSKTADKKYFYFPDFSFDLNNLTEEMKTALPRTDSRFRPDQRLLELQDIDKAADEKNRVEVKQRAARAKFKKEGTIVKPNFFEETYDDLTGELIYLYKGNYFEDRKNKNFGDLPDIF